MKASLFILVTVLTTIAIQISIANAMSYPKAPGKGKADPPPSQSPATQPTSQPTATVKIDNFEFEPKELNVAVGTTVTWQNADDVPHTATSKDDPQTFDSGALDTDEKFSFTFTKPGTYTYYCKVHTHMTGVVIVK
jgi:plastocyanin